MEKHILSILVENHAGVLSRISGLFARRGYNIDSLSVGVTDDPKYSRITVVAIGDAANIIQITNQVAKLVDVVEIMELDTRNTVTRELSLIKVKTDNNNRSEIISIAEIFKASIIDVSKQSVTVELTGEPTKINAFIALMEDHGVIELVRTGLSAISRGAKII